MGKEDILEAISELTLSELSGAPTSLPEFIKIDRAIPTDDEDDYEEMVEALEDLAEVITDRILDSERPTSVDLDFLQWLHTGGTSIGEIDGGAIIHNIDRDLFPLMSIADQCDFLASLFDEFKGKTRSIREETLLRGSGQYYDRFLTLFEDFQRRGDETVANRLMSLSAKDVPELAKGPYLGAAPSGGEIFHIEYESGGKRIHEFLKLLGESYHPLMPIHETIGRIHLHLESINLYDAVPPRSFTPKKDLGGNPLAQG